MVNSDPVTPLSEAEIEAVRERIARLAWAGRRAISVAVLDDFVRLLATIDDQRAALRQTEAALSRALATVIDRGDPFDGDDWSVANEVLRPALKGVFTREVAVKAPEGFRPAKEA